MDWLFFYQSGAVVTFAVAIFTIFRFEDVTEQERLQMGAIFLCGLLVWPAVLFGLIILNTQMSAFKRQS